VICGIGADSVVADGLDLVAQDGFEWCEAVDRAATTTQTTTTQTTTTEQTPAVLKPPTLGLTRTGRARVRCPAACNFVLSVVISEKLARRVGLKGILIGRMRGALAAAGTKRVTIRLSDLARRKLRNVDEFRARLKLRVKDGAGNITRRSLLLTLGG
jgi:hypothetical protein